MHMKLLKLKSLFNHVECKIGEFMMVNCEYDFVFFEVLAVRQNNFH